MKLRIDVNVHLGSRQDLDRLVDVRKAVPVEFSYPLAKPHIAELTAERPWTANVLIDAIAKHYAEIYKEEAETATLPTEPAPGAALMNRPMTDGKYGIWGHTLDDLFLEGMELRDGVWHLEMGS